MLSIIIPAHNEGRRIGTALDGLLTHLGAHCPQGFEVIVIPNGCVDDTVEIVKEYSNRFPQIRIGEFKEKIGKGGAMKEGSKLARGDIIAFLDADGATSPAEVCRLAEMLKENDAVIGSRWLPGSLVPVRQPLLRRIASRGFNLLVRLLFRFPFRDTQCGAKIVRKQALDRIQAQLQITNFAFDIELLYTLNRAGYKIEEVPITWEDQTGSSLKMRRTVPTMFLAAVRLRVVNSPLRGMVENRFSAYLYRKLWGKRL